MVQEGALHLPRKFPLQGNFNDVPYFSEAIFDRVV